MIIVDSALARRHAEGTPIRVAMIGAGFMGRGIAMQLARVRGMQLVAICNRNIDGAIRAFEQSGIDEVDSVSSASGLENSIRSGRVAVTDDPGVACDAAQIDAIIEATGTVEFASRVVLHAINRGKHVVLMNAELDGTLGPLLKRDAERAGVVITNADGDQPGTIMNLYRFVVGIGVKPVLCGNIKSLQDRFRNPITQEAFARRWKQKPHMVTSFADGTKISFEQALVANATGMRVGRRGMHGPNVEPGTHVSRVAGLYPEEDLLTGPGIVDYVVGAEPGPGVFVIGTHDDEIQREYLKLFKLGDGPLYTFYTPYHLCHMEIQNAVARAVLFQDATIAPLGPPRVEVITTAKRNLKAGEVLDGIGYYMTYGQVENADVTYRERLLPMGLAEGCRLTRDVPCDAVISYSDVTVPEGRFADRLREEQDAYFFGGTGRFVSAGNE